MKINNLILKQFVKSSACLLRRTQRGRRSAIFIYLFFSGSFETCGHSDGHERVDYFKLVAAGRENDSILNLKIAKEARVVFGSVCVVNNWSAWI